MTAAPFLFGKLPAHGDFIARALDDRARALWDVWSADLLGVLKAQTGGAFEAAHVSAPPWRFLIREPAGWTAGAVAPSVDGVGRRFLLALGARALPDMLAGAAGLAFAEVAEGLVYDALANRLDADALLARATGRFGELAEATGAAAMALAATSHGEGLWWTLGSEGFAATAIGGREPPGDLFARTVAAAAPGLEPA